jgi:hypothetical protein
MRDRNSGFVPLTLVVCLDDVNPANSAVNTLAFPSNLLQSCGSASMNHGSVFFDFLISRPAGFPFQLEYELLAEC